jgi:hypothetical protein
VTQNTPYDKPTHINPTSCPTVIDYEKCYFLLGIIKLKAKENTVK